MQAHQQLRKAYPKFSFRLLTFRPLASQRHEPRLPLLHKQLHLLGAEKVLGQVHVNCRLDFCAVV